MVMTIIIMATDYNFQLHLIYTVLSLNHKLQQAEQQKQNGSKVNKQERAKYLGFPFKNRQQQVQFTKLKLKHMGGLFRGRMKKKKERKKEHKKMRGKFVNILYINKFCL